MEEQECKTLWVFGGTSELARSYMDLQHGNGFAVRLITRKIQEDLAKSCVVWNPTNLGEAIQLVEGLPFQLGDEVMIANGYLGPYGGWENVLAAEADELENLVSANLIAPTIALVASLKKLSSLGGGRIVLLSSLAAHPVLDVNPIYGQMKRFLDDLAISAWKNSRNQRASVTLVIARVGFVRTKLNSGRLSGGFSTNAAEVAKRISSSNSGVVWCPWYGSISRLIKLFPPLAWLASKTLRAKLK